MSLKQLIEDTMKKEGIDLIGFAGKERFRSVDAAHNPFSIFPEGETVILLGKRICRGSLRGVEEGTNFTDYQMYGRSWLEDQFLSLACYNLVRVLEDEGWEACPVFCNPSDVEPMGVAVEKGRPEPNVFPDFNYAAVACGLGEIGRNGLLLTPRFGSRQRFHMIITDAVIPSSPLLERSVCDNCGLCAKSCPLGAIDTENTTTVEICGKKMECYNVKLSLCRQCKNGAVPPRSVHSRIPDRIPALCNRSCLCHLEESKAVESQFENRFRQREAWSVGEKEAKQ